VGWDGGTSVVFVGKRHKREEWNIAVCLKLPGDLATCGRLWLVGVVRAVDFEQSIVGSHFAKFGDGGRRPSRRWRVGGLDWG